MKKLFIDLTIGIILIVSSFALGYCICKSQIMDRYEYVLHNEKGNFNIDNVEYVVLGKTQDK